MTIKILFLLHKFPPILSVSFYQAFDSSLSLWSRWVVLEEPPCFCIATPKKSLSFPLSFPCGLLLRKYGLWGMQRWRKGKKLASATKTGAKRMAERKRGGIRNEGAVKPVIECWKMKLWRLNERVKAPLLNGVYTELWEFLAWERRYFYLLLNDVKRLRFTLNNYPIRRMKITRGQLPGE